jgi:hypothetical protein
MKLELFTVTEDLISNNNNNLSSTFMPISFNPELHGSPPPALQFHFYSYTHAHWTMDDSGPEKFFMRWLRELNPYSPIVNL